ncbi:hypothetical protein FRB99_007395 [Tulasnella sp. 403]|nr:hypothetical protein FRB99_007395 [Tulasnella sp. 403]
MHGQTEGPPEQRISVKKTYYRPSHFVIGLGSTRFLFPTVALSSPDVPQGNPAAPKRVVEAGPTAHCSEEGGVQRGTLSLDIYYGSKVSHLDVAPPSTNFPDPSFLQEILLPFAPEPEEEATTQAGVELQVKLESLDPFSISGGFGDIFVGRDDHGNKVAAKRAKSTANIEADALRRLQREGTTWQRLNHKFVLRFLGTACIGDRLYLVSPFIENGSLSVYTRSHPDIDRICLLRESADAIAYLHAQDILHGDIKASNVLVSDDMHALVCDFGLARAIGAATSSMLRGAGSVRWQAPELWKKQPKSTKTDVYAFGMLISEVLGGNVPFREFEELGGVMLTALEGGRPPKEPSESPLGVSYESVWNVAELCWAHKAETRPRMQEVYRLMVELSPIQA